ncbi:MAG: diguanylate cyclase [Selenomonadaceae bacterium]|nr:diguanylate cyclase [Selenomonadaceae bacterium]
MKERIFHFAVSALLYWLIAFFGTTVLVIPDEVIVFPSFLPPILGLMWGPVAVAGLYVGSILSLPELKTATDTIGFQWLMLRNIWVIIAGLLPIVIWHRWRVKPGEPTFPLSGISLSKILVILLVTYACTSVFRGFMATPEELKDMGGWLGHWKTARLPGFILAAFVSDFLMALFFDVVWFFFLISQDFSFYGTQCPPGNKAAATITQIEMKGVWVGALVFYAIAALTSIHLDVSAIYGMERLPTWMQFMAECLSLMDLSLILMLHLLLHYRRSIMMQIVFLVAMTVVLSAAVLGWSSSLSIDGIVTARADDNLHAMSVICRERLERTFFCVRQAVNGMERQALVNIESYDRLRNDETYRNNYLALMENAFNDIATSTDGSNAFYLRLAPEIAGGKGGFSMGRLDVRWEGALPPFVKRDPIDLTNFFSEDAKNVGWYYVALNSKHATWIEPYVDPTIKDYVISYVAPLRVDGHNVGVIGMDIDFNFIIQELRRMSIYNYGYVYIMNRNGMVLYHSEQAQGTIFRPNPNYKEMEIYLTNGMWLGVAIPLERVNDERNRLLMHQLTAVMVVAMLVALGSITLASKAIKPLMGMTEAAKLIASGDLNVKLSYESGNELGLLVQSIRDMAAKLEVYVYRDKLTGLRNAASYFSKGKELDMIRESDPDLEYGVVIFDANFLKKINDEYGHQAGNQLIRHAARVICRVFAHSPVYRIGGDEFAAILIGQDYDNRKELLSRFDEQAAAERFSADGKDHVVSVARGLGEYQPGMDYAEVAKLADAAMYNHKAALKLALGMDVDAR